MHSRSASQETSPSGRRVHTPSPPAALSQFSRPLFMAGGKDIGMPQDSRLWCGTCAVQSAVARGEMTPELGRAALQAPTVYPGDGCGPVYINNMGKISGLHLNPRPEMVPRQDPRILRKGRAARRDGIQRYWIDTSGSSGKCNSTRQTAIVDGVNYIASHMSYLPSSCTPNMVLSDYSDVDYDEEDDYNGYDCQGGGTRFACFAGHAPYNDPATLLTYTLDGSTRFKIHCNKYMKGVVGSEKCKNRCIAGWTRCGQWSQRWKDIHICKSWLTKSPAPSNAEVGFLIAHEIWHVWGATESAAVYMNMTTPGVGPSSFACW